MPNISASVPENFEIVWEVVKAYPGLTILTISRVLDWHRSKVVNVLKSMPRNGYMVYEDDDGGIYPMSSELKRDYYSLFKTLGSFEGSYKCHM